MIFPRKNGTLGISPRDLTNRFIVLYDPKSEESPPQKNIWIKIGVQLKGRVFYLVTNFHDKFVSKFTKKCIYDFICINIASIINVHT